MAGLGRSSFEARLWRHLRMTENGLIFFPEPVRDQCAEGLHGAGGFLAGGLDVILVPVAAPSIIRPMIEVPPTVS